MKRRQVCSVGWRKFTPVVLKFPTRGDSHLFVFNAARGGVAIEYLIILIAADWLQITTTIKAVSAGYSSKEQRC